MRIVIGVDWSDESFATVQQVLQLYRPAEIALVHGVDLRIFKHPGLVDGSRTHEAPLQSQHSDYQGSAGLDDFGGSEGDGSGSRRLTQSQRG